MTMHALLITVNTENTWSVVSLEIAYNFSLNKCDGNKTIQLERDQFVYKQIDIISHRTDTYKPIMFVHN